MAAGIRTTNLPKNPLVEVLGHFDAGAGQRSVGRQSVGDFVAHLLDLAGMAPSEVAAISARLEQEVEDRVAGEANLSAGSASLQQQIAAANAASLANDGARRADIAAISAGTSSLQQQVAANAAVVLGLNAARVAEIATLGSAAGGLQQQIAANALIASNQGSALQALIDDLTDRLADLATTEAAGTDKAAADLLREVEARQNALSDEMGARLATDAELLLRTEAAVLSDRPGDARAAFTFTSTVGGLAGPRNALPILPISMIAVGDAGAEARITGPGILGMRRAVAVEPGREYQPRVVLRRRSNPSDPSGDAVRFGIVWFDRSLNLLPFQQASTVVETFRALVTGDGRQERQALFSRSPSPQPALTAPAAARYAAGYVQFFGPDGVTGVEVLGISDVSEGAILAPETASTVQQVAALVSMNSGPRLDALESRVGSPESVTFATRNDAQAGQIPDSASIVELLGLAGVGDGGWAQYVRATGAVPEGSDSFTNTLTGAVFVRVVPSAALVASMLRAGFASWLLSLPEAPDGLGPDQPWKMGDATSGYSLAITGTNT